MVKIRGRPSRTSYQPRPESVASCVSESENDTFLTATSNQPSFVSAEATFTAGSAKNDFEDETLLESDTVVPLADIESVLNVRTTRSALRNRRQSKSVMDINKTPKAEPEPSPTFSRKEKRRRSAPGVVHENENMKRKMSESTEDVNTLKMLESTPTDHAAAKRKLQSEPARKQMLLNLSPIEVLPHTLQRKAKSENSAPTLSKQSEINGAANDTICITKEPEVKKPASAKKDPKLVAQSTVRANTATSRVNNSPLNNRKPIAGKSQVLAQKARPEPPRKLTLPMSPKFATTQRIHGKPIDYEPYEVREKKVVEEMKRYRFKAQPVPRAVIKASTVTIAKPETKPTKSILKPKEQAKSMAGPSTSSTHAVGAAKNVRVETKETHKDRAMRLTGGGVLKKKSTEAKTPNFKMSDRIKQKADMKKMMEEASRQRQLMKDEEEKQKRLRFMKVALRGATKPAAAPVVSSAPVEKLTKPEPFSFYQSDMVRKERKERKIQEVFEEEKRKREFRANPLPNLNVVSGLPEKDVKPITRPQPFNLASEDRIAAAHTTWSTTVDSAILETEVDQYQFKARPMPDLSVPFIPERSHKEATEPLPIVLHTAVRAEDRKPFDDYVKQRQDELEEVKRQRELEMEEEERREALKLRKSMVHHAQPIRQYKPTIIEHHRIPPTVPESPALATRTRAKYRAAAAAMSAAIEEDELNELNDSSDTYVVGDP